MNIQKQIVSLKAKLGPSLCILAHHYQADDVVIHADIVGDSLELARQIPELAAEHIVFCGVHFMAETAAILAGANQHVYAPDASAGCVMANMAPAPLLETILNRLQSGGKQVIPLTYVNSSAAVKAVCGRFGGSVCTSANAAVMLRWTLDQGDAVLFLPDANLGQNTATAVGLGASAIKILNIRGGGQYVQALEPDHRLLLWPGVCAVHAKIHAEHIQKIRNRHPQGTILVHPECDPQVVALADGAGSTSYLINKVQQAATGRTMHIGTEANLVHRLQRQHPDKTICSLHPIWCSNMAKTTAEKLLDTLTHLQIQSVVRVGESIAASARLALERMLAVCS
ncbi:MAG: quinolinate synthase NadA [Desulfomicrobium sp.]|nr:quinolinate synthase NadA [Desulfomicrobium sp.]